MDKKDIGKERKLSDRKELYNIYSNFFKIKIYWIFFLIYVQI